MLFKWNRPSPPIMIWAGVLFLLTLVQVFLPLFGEPGYEAAQAQALFFALASGHLCVSLALRQKRGGASRALLALFCMLFADIGLIALAGLFRGACEWGDNLLWFALLPAVTIVLGAAMGAFAAQVARRPRYGHLVYGLAVLSLVAYELWVVYRLPLTFSYSTLLGYFPGPLYDKAVRVSVPLIASRAKALAGAGVFFALTAMMADRVQGFREKDSSISRGLILFISLALFVIVTLYGEGLGLSVSRGRIHEELGGYREGRNILLYYPEDLPENELRLLMLDNEFRFAQQSRFLGLSDAPPVSAYYYRNAGEKKALVGAGTTQFADCWNREMHMNLRSVPHGVLKHEIVHVLASAWGLPGLGFSRVLGLTEGLAVASERWRGDDAIPYWAAAMKKVGRLPRISRISGPTGFWKLSGTRSYLAWGGFVTWLIETRSMEAVAAVYKSGDFQKVFGRSLRRLEKDWEEHLDTLEVSPRLLRVAAYRFFRKSLFETRCARSLGRVSEDAGIALRMGRNKKAARLFQRAVDFSGGATRPLQSLMIARFECRRYDQAWALAGEIIDREGAALTDASPAGKPIRGNLRAAARALLTQGRIAWLQGRLGEAKDLYTRVRRADVLSWMNREAAVSLLSLADPAIEGRMRKVFVDPEAAGSSTYQILKAIEARPSAAFLHYLLGRRLAAKNQYEEAVDELELALDLGLEDHELAVAAWRKLGKTLFESGRTLEAIIVFETRAPLGISPGKSMEAEEWVDRCRFAMSYRFDKEGS